MISTQTKHDSGGWSILCRCGNYSVRLPPGMVRADAVLVYDLDPDYTWFGPDTRLNDEEHIRFKMNRPVWAPGGTLGLEEALNWIRTNIPRNVPQPVREPQRDRLTPAAKRANRSAK